jgi:hypothetical protein
MKETSNGKSGTKLFFHMVLPGLVLLALTLSFSGLASAAGDSDGDSKVQAMRSDVAACMQSGTAGQKAREAFAKKYDVPLSKINEKVPGRAPAGNGGWDDTTAMFVCTAEYLTAVGGIIWGRRSNMDKYIGDSVLQYCVSYSKVCDHYNWQQDCLKKYSPSCCN